jgi:hypothetical protein
MSQKAGWFFRFVCQFSCIILHNQEDKQKSAGNRCVAVISGGQYLIFIYIITSHSPAGEKELSSFSFKNMERAKTQMPQMKNVSPTGTETSVPVGDRTVK